jgi:hypothetical protein
VTGAEPQPKHGRERQHENEGDTEWGHGWKKPDL